MKYIFSILALSLLVFSNANAQNEVTLKIKYSPETTIHQEFKNSMTMKMDSKSKEMKEALKKKGNTTKSKSTMLSSITIGQVYNEVYVPLVFRIEAIDMGTNKMPQAFDVTKVKFYGHCHKDSLPVFDSIAGNSAMQSLFSSLMKNVIGGSYAEDQFPKYALIPGDTFSTTKPMNLPIPSFSMEMLINNHFKILKIKDNKAYLQVNQTFLFTGNNSSANISATGGGKGVLIYDMQTMQYSGSKIKTKMKMIMNMMGNNISMDMNVESNLVQTLVKH